MSNSVQPRRRQPTRLLCPWDSPGKNTGVGCHFLLQCMKVKSESEVAQSCLTLHDPHGLQPTRLLHPWEFPGKSTEVGCHCLLRHNPRSMKKTMTMQVMPMWGFEEWELIRKKSCIRDRSWMNVCIMLWLQKSTWEWGSWVVEIKPEAENTVTVSHCKAIAKICVCSVT